MHLCIDLSWAWALLDIPDERGHDLHFKWPNARYFSDQALDREKCDRIDTKLYAIFVSGLFDRSITCLERRYLMV